MLHAAGRLDGGSLEQADRFPRRNYMHTDRSGPGRFAGDRHVVRIPSKGRDVPLHPAQGRALIFHAVAAVIIGDEGRDAT